VPLPLRFLLPIVPHDLVEKAVAHHISPD